MKSIALAIGAVVAALSTTAIAQDYRYGREWRGTNHECWNPRAGAYEGVREGERQNDLDHSRCRAVGDHGRFQRDSRSTQDQCWNPRARRFEDVREGERQDDLDFSHCRPVASEYSGRPRYR